MFKQNIRLLKGQFPFLLMLTDIEIIDLMRHVQRTSEATNRKMEDILTRINDEMETVVAHV